MTELDSVDREKLRPKFLSMDIYALINVIIIFIRKFVDSFCESLENPILFFEEDSFFVEFEFEIEMNLSH